VRLAVTINVDASLVTRAGHLQKYGQTSTSGKLVATIPLASPCHDDKFAEYNVAECQSLRDGRLEPQTHYVSSSSIMAPFFANMSCDPFLPESARCIIGTYVSYAVDVSEVSDVAKTIRFATQHNIRLVIRNTGHE